MSQGNSVLGENDHPNRSLLIKDMHNDNAEKINEQARLDTSQPRVQFRLQSAQVGGGGRERNKMYITKPIVVEQRSLVLLNDMYEFSKKNKPRTHNPYLLNQVESQPRLNCITSFHTDKGVKDFNTPELHKYRDKSEQPQPKVSQSVHDSQSEAGIQKSQSVKPASLTKVKFGTVGVRPESRSEVVNDSKKVRQALSVNHSRADLNRADFNPSLLTVQSP